jgi:hypothetical protein
VNNGLFTTLLDFGSQFPGASRYLEIGVPNEWRSHLYHALAPATADAHAVCDQRDHGGKCGGPDRAAKHQWCAPM